MIRESLLLRRERIRPNRGLSSGYAKIFRAAMTFVTSFVMIAFLLHMIFTYPRVGIDYKRRWVG